MSMAATLTVTLGKQQRVGIHRQQQAVADRTLVGLGLPTLCRAHVPPAHCLRHGARLRLIGGSSARRPARVIVAVSRRLRPVRSGIVPVMLGCGAVLRGMLPVALGGCSVPAGLEAAFLRVRQAGLDAFEGLDEVRPVCGSCVTVPSAHRPVGGGTGPVASVLGAGGAAGLRRGVTFLGPAVTVLGSQVTPVRAFSQFGDPCLGHGPPAAKGLAITRVGLAVPAVGVSVALICLSVTFRGHSVAMVSSPVPLVGGLVDGISAGLCCLTRGPGLLASRVGPSPGAGRLVAKLRLPIALI